MEFRNFTRYVTDPITKPIAAIGDMVGEPVIRLGVTGLSRAGKTVFITSLVANLLDRERMAGLSAARDGRISAVTLEPQPDPTLPRFAYEQHMAALLADRRSWPDSTSNISQLRLSFRVERQGFMGIGKGPDFIHLDIVDYPGEWLLDLGLMGQSYAGWSETVLAGLRARNAGLGEDDFLAKIEAIDGDASYDEMHAQDISRAFRDLVVARRKAGMNDLVPGRFLLPGELDGSPAITFAPLIGLGGGRKSLRRQFEARFNAYQSRVIEPFFRDHFARLDRQVVLADVLGAMDRGPGALDGLEEAMGQILSAFRPGANNWFSFLLGKRIDRIAFAATKADQLHHSYHDRLVALTEALVGRASRRARFAGAEVSSKAVAALRATVEETRSHKGQDLRLVRGINETDNRPVSFYFGDLPNDPESFLTRAKTLDRWPDDGDFALIKVAPPDLSSRKRGGVPHIRLDQLVEFLIGDKL